MGKKWFTILFVPVNLYNVYTYHHIKKRQNVCKKMKKVGVVFGLCKIRIKQYFFHLLYFIKRES